MIRIGILTTLWKRAAIERIVMSHYAALEVPGVDLVLLAVGSEGDASRERAEGCGWNYIAARNRPLSDKHNKGMRWFRDKEVAGVMVIGSDDLIDAKSIRLIVAAMKGGADVAAPEDIYYYDQKRGRLHYGVRHHPGAGVLYSAGTLARLDWQLWPKGIDTRLDGQAMNRCHKEGSPSKVRYLDRCRDRGITIIDIKAGENLWSLRELRETTGRVEPVSTDIFDDAFPGVREQLKQLNQPMRETSGY